MTAVLITGEQIAALGEALEVPEGTTEIDATGRIVMPGMIDTYRGAKAFAVAVRSAHRALSGDRARHRTGSGPA